MILEVSYFQYQTVDLFSGQPTAFLFYLFIFLKISFRYNTHTEKVNILMKCYKVDTLM